MKFADVIVPLSVKQTFTYSVPDEYVEYLQVGMRVLVQFGSKKFYTAIVNNIHENKPEYQTKEIISIIDNEQLVNEKNLIFWQWLADYYLANIGDVYVAALPVSLRIESQTQISLSREIIDEKVNVSEQKIIDTLKHQKTLTLSHAAKILNGKTAINTVNKLMQKNIIEVYEHLQTKYKPKFEKYVRLSSDYKNENDLQAAFKQLKSAKKQTEILLAYSALAKLHFVDNQPFYSEVKKKNLLEKAEANANTVNSLYEKGMLVEYEKEVSRFAAIGNFDQNITKLSDVQQNAFKEIKQSFDKFDVTLLHGITSSGKTEIYINLIKEQIDLGKQVLYLLPEIALTTQIIQRLRNAFGDIVGIYHSKFNDSERAEIWTGIKSKNGKKSRFQVILGVRSALFLPYENLGLIIVDEEHENTYKQYDPAPRYHARDASIVLAKSFNAKILLGTATPSIESYYNAKTGKYGLVEIFQRHKNIELPEILIADIRDASKHNKMKSIFHPLMIENIDKALSNGEQVILFQNRRGFAPFVQCNSCGEIVKCVNCDVSLTYHIDSNSLVCHYCGYTKPIPKYCEHCGDTALETRGFGTQKVEDEIKIFFPESTVSRLDLDVAKHKHGYEDVLNNFDMQKVDILVGTQMVTKGLDFENVSVVGVLDADNLLNYPDFRSFERSFQLITQVSGRAGRSNKRGKVIVQTSTPDHEIIKMIQNNDFQSFYQSELKERETYLYPPFVRLIKITTKHKTSELSVEFANNLATLLRNNFGNVVLGPYEPTVKRIQNYFYFEILLKLTSKFSLVKSKRIIYELTEKLHQQPNFSTVQVNFNVDPF